MKYHYWDMDHTIIDNDCDVSWKEFLISTGRVDAGQQKLVDMYFQQYLDGVLKIDEFNEFQLTEFAGKTREEAAELTQAHFEQVVKAKIYPRAKEMIQSQLDAGDMVILLTATNGETAAPLAEELNLSAVVATELEMVDGRFTGKITGTYCCAEGKLERLKDDCSKRGISLTDVHYYGDSVADLPVLRAAGYPHATNPVDKVREEAKREGWPILDFKDK